MVAGCDFLALQVQRVRLYYETDGEIIDFVAVEHPPGELGRLPDRDGQHAGRQRIERAAMADLPLARAADAQGAFDRAHRLRRAKAKIGRASCRERVCQYV